MLLGASPVRAVMPVCTLLRRRDCRCGSMEDFLLSDSDMSMCWLSMEYSCWFEDWTDI